MTSISHIGSHRSDITHGWRSPEKRNLGRIVIGLSLAALVVSLSVTRDQPPPRSDVVEDSVALDLVAIERQVAAMK